VKAYEQSSEHQIMAKDRYADFGRRLKGIMRDRELTQLELSRRTGLSQQSISGWTRGTHVPKGRRLATLAEFLEIPPRELCPEAYDQTAVKLARTAINFSPILGQPDWYVLNCRMPVDRQMLDDVLAANAAFEQRRIENGYDDVELI
jgi:transcriptional regulator with XRE-family HTH domain